MLGYKGLKAGKNPPSDINLVWAEVACSVNRTPSQTQYFDCKPVPPSVFNRIWSGYLGATPAPENNMKNIFLFSQAH